MRGAITGLLAAILMGCSSNEQTGHTETVNIQRTVANDNCNDAAANNKIQEALSITSVMDMSDAEVKAWMAAEDKPVPGLQSYEADTLYDDHCILSVTVHFEWLSAYPSQTWLYMNFDKRTGDSLHAASFIEPSQMNTLLDVLNKRLSVRVSDERKRLSAGDELETYDIMIEQNAPAYTLEHLDNYYLEGDNIIFVYPFDFPHVVLALQPVDTLIFAARDFKPFIRKGGSLDFWLR